MQPQRDLRTILYHIADEAQGPALDVLGPTIEFITQPSRDDDTALCVLRGVVPAGVTVPMHSHDDAEDFYILDDHMTARGHERLGEALGELLTRLVR